MIASTAWSSAAAARRRRIVVIAQSIASVKPGCVLIRADQWLRGTRIHRNVGAAKFDRVQSIARCLLHIDIAGDDRDGGHAHVRRAQSHDERDRIIRRGVRIDEECCATRRED